MCIMMRMRAISSMCKFEASAGQPIRKISVRNATLLQARLKPSMLASERDL